MQTVQAENLVVNNCGSSEFRNFKGGNYTFLHATFCQLLELKQHSLPSFGIYATNEYEQWNSTEQGALTLNLQNSIVLHRK